MEDFKNCSQCGDRLFFYRQDYSQMNIFCKLAKIIITGSLIFIASNFLIINPVFAKNIPAGFGAGTTIATPEGNIAVEKLKKGDRLIGYNFETHQPEENTVTEIKPKSSLSYYLINRKTKLASPNLIYIRTLIRPELVRLNKVKPFNKLFSRKSYSTVVSSIEQVVKATNIYQLTLDNREGNVYADNILIHIGYDLPAYFRNHHVDCKPGTPYFKQCGHVNAKTLPGTLAALGIMFVSLMIASKAIDKLFSFHSSND